MRKYPKIIVFDIEIEQDSERVYNKCWRMYPGATMGAEFGNIITFAYKDLYSGKPTKVLKVWDKKFNENNLKGQVKSSLTDKLVTKYFYDDGLLCEAIHEILADADAIVSFYGKKFDIKYVDARMAHNKQRGFDCHVLPNFKSSHYDVHQIVKQRFKLAFKRLNDVAEFLRLGKKIDTGGVSLWQDVSKGDKKAQKKMADYNIQDVDLLVDIFNSIIGLVPNLMPAWLYDNDISLKCPVHGCRSRHIQSRGYRTTTARKLIRYQCQDCGKWFTVDNNKQKPRGL